MTAELPEAIERLDRYLATARIAHEAIWELHNRLLVLGRYDERARERLREAARIVTVEMPALLREALSLRERWSDEQVLDAAAAERRARELTAEMDRIEPALGGLRARQNEVAREFRGLLDRPP